jgi:uncharacterized membrane protein
MYYIVVIIRCILKFFLTKYVSTST